MSEGKTCGACARYIDVPVDDGGPDDRIGVCPCAWRVDLKESRPLFEGLYQDEEACESFEPVPGAMGGDAE